MKSLTLFVASMICLLGVGMPLEGALMFGARENVNILNSDQVTVTALYGPELTPNRLAGFFDSWWEGGSNPPGGTNALSFNLGATRNIKTIRLSHFGGSEINNGIVETSNDGLSWTSQGYVLSSSGDNRTLTLNSAVDAQYLRLTATDIGDTNGLDRWLVRQIRVLGDTGSMPVDGHVDLVSSTGLAGGVTLTAVGSVAFDTSNASEYVDDALNPLKRKVMWQMDTNDGFVLDFSGTGADIKFTGFALNVVPGHYNAADTFTIEIWDGSSWSTPQPFGGSLVNDLNFFTLAPTVGDQLRFTWTSASGNYVSDVMVFGQEFVIPEPATAMLLALGGLLAAWKSRRQD